ncbi:MAG: bifunctional phosphoglucose/phosphomannose isomerase [Anaerolineae bacterium]|jgi:glucose/mannose-6-phosphate isomerase|nr:bifunctional phosphoglucose/phosphomannose isomerase [Anaerolineae bacterium]MDH7474206.1 bifunctional phosphoglucose/phosphomannose isomerase [Anaerolineae bacterium]
MIDLDNVSSYKKLDPDDMLGRISELPRQCRDAWDNAQSLDMPESYRRANKIIILGMGGSAIGGALLSDLVRFECAVPILVNRDYTVPACMDRQTLAIASSYSGNTEETLISLEQAIKQEAMLLAVATGGKLAERARELQAPLLLFNYKSMPRAALGHSLILLLGVLCKLGLVPDKTADLDEAIAVMENWQTEIKESVPLAKNTAKQLATRLYGKLPVVYGANYLSEVARRWKGQFNENSKNWSFFEQFPELNHNAVLGYQWPAALVEKVVVIFLSSALDHPRNRVRMQVTQEILARQGVQYEVVEARGESPLAQVLSIIHFGDYVSYYLALLNGADPSTVDTISYLKKRLAEYG